MNSKRSYLDTLNAGRQRRPLGSLDQLNQSLEALERQIARPRDAEPRYPGTQPYAQRPLEELRAQSRERPIPYPQPRSYQEPHRYPEQRPAPQAAPRFEQNYQALARDIDRARSQEDGIATVGKIASELSSLREELRHQMTAGLHREFESLRNDIGRAYKSAPSSKESAELGREFERLSGAIQTLADKGDDRSINMLRLEMEQIKGALDLLAREESVQSVDRRFDDFDRRWSAFENRVDAAAGSRADGPGIAMLAERLEQIGSAVNNLPESLSLRSLEEKLRTLAGAVDHFASRENDFGHDTLGMIDERLDEISRAIVASSVAAQSSNLDPELFERIEHRIAALAQQIEEVAAERPGGETIDRLNMLSARVDDLVANANLPEQAMERLGQQIAMIADKIDHAPATPDADYIFQGLEQRFDALSGTMERRQDDALEQGNMLFRDLERRLSEVAGRLDERASGVDIDSGGIMDAIDARFNSLAQRLETRAPDPAGQAALRGLESRLEDISARLDASAAQVANIDPELIRSLEAQVTGLSAHFSRPGTPLPEFEDISPRLSEIERSLTGAHDTIISAAREAAENAVRSLAGSSANTQAVSGLADDLKTLEKLTRRSDERNSKTFEAIHDTLLKIVERLGSLEHREAAEPIPAAKIAIHDAPSMDIDQPASLADAMSTADTMTAVDDVEPVTRTPAQAAAAAALAALGSDTMVDQPERTGRRKSMLGGLARAFAKKDVDADAPAGSAPTVDAPSVDLDEPLDPKLANRPLEPGSGAPDLNAIMRRVRDERAQPTRQGEVDASKSDFIAAARRAAQAAAAEADTLKRQSSLAGTTGSRKLGDLLRARRKPIMMAAAAIMLALAGMQLGKAFLSNPDQAASNDAPPAVVEQKTEIASAAPTPVAVEDMGAAENIGAVEKAQNTAGTEPVRVVGRPDASDATTGSGAEEPPAMTAGSHDEVSPVHADLTGTETATPEIEHASIGQAPATIAADTTGAVIPASAKLAAADPAPTAIDIPAGAGPEALRQAASEGDAKALFEIGSRYAEARGVKEDMASAAKWYEKSAELGFAPAEYRIGNFYEKGLGVARDIQKAKTWYQLAAGQGNASAMHNLAVLFAMAADGVTDNESAARWFQAAADLGVKDSQFNLGILAAKGVGMPQNLEDAYKWFALVAKTGDKDAASKRDEIAKALRPEQLERARATTELWKAKPLDQAANSVDIPESWHEGTPAVTASIDMKKAVQNIQRILNKNGYDAGGADGVMGQKTKTAIMAFQGDNDMKPTGEVDEKLVKALLAHK
ncbi:peptidoglycan-binding protein [Mesorhizobium sp. A623]